MTARLRHRVPMPLRQHWKLLVAFIASIALVATVFGATRIQPYITGDATVLSSPITENLTGPVDLFDDAVGHTLELSISDTEYREMLAAYQDNGDKKWVTADVTIDGLLISDVGVRLKGNSTLIGLGGDGNFTPPEGMELPEGFAPPHGMAMPDAGGAMGGGAMGAAMSVSADDPASLPLLISFNKNHAGRAYQGMTQLSVRPGSPVLNEALALSLTAETDQPSQRHAYTSYSINGGATATRLVLENPDEQYANSLFDSDGYLYKADAGSRLEYAGEDQSNYSGQFKQVNARDAGTLQPVINFLRWLDSADDATFDAELGYWVDVDSFARYVATQNLLSNGDDMAGPGQNYYLWYDLDTQLISVMSWDLNMAMSGDTAAGPQDTVSMMPEDLPSPPKDVPAFPGGGDAKAPGAGGTAPTGDGAAPEFGPPGMDAGVLGGNSLKTRFLASESFTPLYEAAYWELFEQIYGDGAALEVLARLESTVPVTDALTAESRDEEISTLRAWVEQRTAALAAMRG